MSALSQLLDRLRRMRPPPGPAASVVAVPSAGDELAVEVAFLFEPLDEIEERSRAIILAARAEAKTIEAAAMKQRQRMLEQARANAELVAVELLAGRRASCDRDVRAIIADAEHEAAQVSARGRTQTPALVEQVVARLLESAP